MEYTLNLTDRPFDLARTLESGQVFRWEKRGEWWYSVLSTGVVKIEQEHESLRCVSSTSRIGPEQLHEYLGLDDDLPAILSSVTKGKRMLEAAQRFYGLRLLRQPVWECLLSFSLATNINIPRLVGMVRALSSRFGELAEFEGDSYWLFPSPDRLATASSKELSSCGLGYRAKFVKDIAGAVYEGRLDLNELLLLDYGRARELLTGRVLNRKNLLGIGPKVADCVLLFSCGKYEAFPIDIWVARAIARDYPSLLDSAVANRLELAARRDGRLSARDYESISHAARTYFGPYSGYAQQYLYELAREEGWPPHPTP